VPLTLKKAGGEMIEMIGTRLRCGDGTSTAEDDRMSVVSAAPSVVTQKVFSFPFFMFVFKPCFESGRFRKFC
jgi:hypothetical protein